ncbi:MAG: LysR family transcriptional regulator [Hyphomicrobiales bacterium]|nr:LysR family transcriptional regulator [Hyphomicrobiales bacterium]MCP5372419.1 LysR family transcriptional regulator [Hyphomicrobiales bacterium]
MNLRQLEAFRAVMEIGTVSQAAEMMRISQPAVSKLIAALEHDVGFSLFDRAKGRLVPTPEGEMLFTEVERAFVSTALIARAAENIRDRKQGHLNIGAMPALTLGFLQEVVARFLRDRPNVLVSLHSRSSLEVVNAVAGRQMDMGITMAAIDNPGVDTEFLCRAELVCAIPPNHRLADRDVIEPRDLEDEPFISLTSLDRTRQRIDHPMEEAGVRRNVMIETPMSYSACAFVAKGIGVSIVDPFSAHDFHSAPIVLKPFRPKVETDIALRFPFRRRRSMLIEEFIALLRAYIAERTDLPVRLHA